MKLNYKRTILIGLSFMSILAFWQFYDQVIPYLLEYKFNLGTFEANAIMSIDNILASVQTQHIKTTIINKNIFFILF